MLKSVEILNNINTVKEKMANLQKEGKIDEAYQEIENLKNLQKELEIAEKLEENKIENLKKNGSPISEGEEINVNNVFNKLVQGKRVTEDEYEAYKNSVGSPGQVEHEDEKGGYLVPEEQGKTLKEFRRFRIALKEFTNVVPVNTLSGKFPVATKQDGQLTNFEELNEIGKSEITFAQQTWDVADYGDIIPVSNTLLEDTDFNLIEIIGSNFTKKAVNTENAKILELLKTMTTGNKVVGTDYKDIQTILNVKLDPAIASTSVIITNQSGFDYLDKLEDGNKRPILTTDLTNPTQKLFKGKRIVVLTDELLPLDTKKFPFYIGDLKEAINFYDRKGVEIAKSTEAGFTKNATLLRAIERFDVKEVDTEAVVYLTVPAPTEAD